MSDLETTIVCIGETRDQGYQYEAIRADKVLKPFLSSNCIGLNKYLVPHKGDSTLVWIKGWNSANSWSIKTRFAWEQYEHFDLTPLYEWEEVMPTPQQPTEPQKTLQQLVAEYLTMPERTMAQALMEKLSNQDFWDITEESAAETLKDILNDGDICKRGADKFLEWIGPKWANVLRPNDTFVKAVFGFRINEPYVSSREDHGVTSDIVDHLSTYFSTYFDGAYEVELIEYTAEPYMD